MTPVEHWQPWKFPPYPFIYEIDTWPWLEQLSRAEGRAIDLGNVPADQWDAIAEGGYDAVWLMGVWRRSPVGISIALGNDGLVASFASALPDFTPEDVVGSPYCIREYVVDDHLGGPSGLRTARSELARRGIGLVLDFVPNHVAPDHPWTVDHADRFVEGSQDDLTAQPDAFVMLGGRVLARGRDPYFPAWPDVVQLNAFAPNLRAAVVATLRDIADQCDAVRCDMAMLMMNDVFQRTWGDRAGPRPDDDYWPTVISAVRETHPDLRFIAEAYWDLEWALQQQGFDYCYDKRLYDRLLSSSPEEVRLHLLADAAYQDGLVRFVENHDEPRLASLVSVDRDKALTVAALTQTGARLVHHGQEEGRRVHLPVFLRRYPDEPVDAGLAEFHRSLMTALRDPTFRHGRWELCERSGWDGNDRADNLVAWCWLGETRWLVVVNLSDATSAAHVRVPWVDVQGRSCRLMDPMSGATFERSGDDLRNGLYVELAPWSWHLLRIET
jgi:hypothetical protein